MNFFKNMLNSLTNQEKEYKFTIPIKENNSDAPSPEDLIKKQKVYSSLDVNLEYVYSRFNTLMNSDIKIRKFLLNVKSREFKAFILYIDGMVSKESINDFILKPLMLKNIANQYDGKQVVSEAVASNILIRKVKKFNVVEYISDSLLPWKLHFICWYC